MKNLNTYDFFILTILATLFCITSYVVVNYNDGIYDERCSMYDLDGHFKRYEESNVNGLYFPAKEYYLVWVKDRTLNEIEKTDKHEYCHWLVDVNYEHFCKEE